MELENWNGPINYISHHGVQIHTVTDAKITLYVFYPNEHDSFTVEKLFVIIKIYLEVVDHQLELLALVCDVHHHVHDGLSYHSQISCYNIVVQSVP